MGKRRLVPLTAKPINKAWMDAIRPRRRGGRIRVWAWGCRVYVPCPPGVKAAVSALARVANMSEAELGLRIFQAALADEGFLKLALADASRQVFPPSSPAASASAVEVEAWLPSVLRELGQVGPVVEQPAASFEICVFPEGQGFRW